MRSFFPLFSRHRRRLVCCGGKTVCCRLSPAATLAISVLVAPALAAHMFAPVRATTTVTAAAATTSESVAIADETGMECTRLFQTP